MGLGTVEVGPASIPSTAEAWTPPTPLESFSYAEVKKQRQIADFSDPERLEQPSLDLKSRLQFVTE